MFQDVGVLAGGRDAGGLWHEGVISERVWRLEDMFYKGGT